MRKLNVVVAFLAVVLCLPMVEAQAANLRLMTFNVWAGEDSTSGRNKLAEIISTAGADVIGLQEMDDSAGRSIAAALGFHYHQQSGGDIQVLSRYPIVGQSTNNLGVQIAISPGQRVWLFNAHLSPYPYQPYDLRDGLLPKNESAVISAANAARGGQVTTYLSEMTGAIASDEPVFLTGDFNEPSHLDWTNVAASATGRVFDLKVEYPASKRIVSAGMIDSFRAVRPDEVSDPAYTWTPGAPYPNVAADEVHDRIDIIYHSGPGVVALSAFTVGPLDGNPNTHLSIAGYNADHRAVVVDFQLASLVGDLNSDGQLTALDWTILRANQHTDLSGLTALEAWQRGDLNGDLRNDHADFTIFKSSYEDSHGAGSFASMMLVPEPETLRLLLLVGFAAQRRRRAKTAAY